MKKVSYIVAFVLCTLLGAANGNPQTVPTQKDDFEKMSFEIERDRDTYLPLEPIDIRCTFSNMSNVPLVTYLPDFLAESWLQVTSGNEKTVFNSLSLYRVNLVRRPATVPPGARYEAEITLETNLDKFFPKPGSYVVRLILNGSAGKQIESNPVNILIVEPTGIDKDALSFIKQNAVYNQRPMLFTWKEDAKGENGESLLEEFVEKYGQSSYGEFAIYQLGSTYLHKHEFEKAKSEFEKLVLSRNPRIVKLARKSLVTVERNRGLEKSND